MYKSRSKYVVGIYRDTARRSGPEGRFFQQEVAVVFDPEIKHSDMRRLFMSVEGAGFCTVSPSDGKVFCHGRSESLGIESRPDIDTPLVARALGLS